MKPCDPAAKRIRLAPMASYCRQCLRALVDGEHPAPLVDSTDREGPDAVKLRKLAREISGALR